MKKTKEHRKKLSRALKGAYTGDKSPHFKNEVGNKYGKLTVLEYVCQKKNRGSMWRCRCECGNTTIVDGAHMRNGHTKSCGCLLRKTGKDNPSWRGGRFRSNGYIYIYKPDHPNAFFDRKYVSEHVYIMSKHLGRPIEKGEVVHHKNGDRTDNRIDNLELRTIKTHPPGQSVKDIVDHAIEVLRKHSPEMLCKECHKHSTEHQREQAAKGE